MGYSKKILYTLVVFLSIWTTKVRADSIGAKLDMDTNGNAISVWEDEVPGVIKSAIFAGGEPWSSVTIISDPAVKSSAPIIIMNDLNQAIAMWTFYDATLGIDRLAASMRSVLGWGPVSIISATNESVLVGSVVIPNYRLKLTAGNIAVVTYLSNMNNHTVVRTSNAAFGGVWSSPITLSD